MRAKLIYEFVDDFMNWFKNSKIVDENGNPLVVYHGTNSNFNIFKCGKNVGRSNEEQIEGIYFTDNKEGASFFTNFSDDSNFLKSVYLSIQNPYITNGIKSLKQELKINNLKKVRTILIKMGFDGLILENGFYAYGGPHRAIIAFYPNQIRLKNN